MPQNRSVPDVVRKRREWHGVISGFKVNNLVFLDESGCNTDMRPGDTPIRSAEAEQSTLRRCPNRRTQPFCRPFSWTELCITRLFPAGQQRRGCGQKVGQVMLSSQDAAYIPKGCGLLRTTWYAFDYTNWYSHQDPGQKHQGIFLSMSVHKTFRFSACQRNLHRLRYQENIPFYSNFQ